MRTDSEVASTAHQHTIRLLGFTYLKGRRFSRRPLLALAFLDWLFLLLFGRDKRSSPPPLQDSVIAISKIDLLGDVLMITPVLAELRKQVPSSRLLLIIGSWSKELGDLLLEKKLCDAVTYYDPALMNSGKLSFPTKLKQWAVTFFKSWRFLRAEKPSVFLDFRSYSPNSLLLARLARVPHKIGFGLRGYAYFLQQEIPYQPEESMGQSYLDALQLLGLRSDRYQRPLLPAVDRPSDLPETSYAVVHPFSRDPRKMHSPQFWSRLLPIITSGRKVVLIGSREDLDCAELLNIFMSDGQVVSRVGTTSFREAMSCIQECEFFVGVDSVFSHVALAYHRPAFVLGLTGVSYRQAFPQDNPQLSYVEVDPAEPLPESLEKTLADFVNEAAERTPLR